MRQLNVLGVESPFGFKLLEVYHGDIVAVEPPASILVVSVWTGPGAYLPTRGSLVETLRDHFGIDLEKLRDGGELDLVDELGFWLSHPLTQGPAHRILGLETWGDLTDVDKATENLLVGLAVLEAKGISVQDIVLPLIGTGSQLIDATSMMSSLLSRFRPYLEESRHTERIRLVERDEYRARLIAAGMDDVLGRDKVVLPKGELINEVQHAICGDLDAAVALCSGKEKAILLDMIEVFGRDSPLSYELGVAVRRFAEVVTAQLADHQQETTPLAEQIRHLPSKGVANWIRTYLDVMRVFGNESAHAKPLKFRQPPTVEEADLAVCLVCTHRILEFWLSWLKGAFDEEAT